MKAISIITTAITVLVLASRLSGSANASDSNIQTAPASATDASTLSLEERVFMTSKMYADMGVYCAHLQTIPDFDLDAAYKSYLKEALAASGRYEFDLASMAFVATLHNGHSEFFDRWLSLNYGASMGFRALFIEGKWTVTRSEVTGLKPGDIIERIDSTPVEELFQKQKRYLNASNERWARTIFFNRRYLFPQTFELTLQGGRKVAIDRKLKLRQPDLKTEGQWMKADSVAYIKVPSFDAPEFEQTAIELVKKYHTASSLIIDLRGNGGGSTPGDLIDCLMDRPYRGSSQATPLSLAVIKTRGGFFDRMKQDPAAKKDEMYGYLEAMKELSDNAQLYFPSRPQKPENSLFKGALYILIDRDVFSAGEDFCIPFKDNHRATFIGETTGGSTGQPYFYLFSNGSGFRVSAKRDSFPDGSPLEGVGVTPDISIPISRRSLTSRRDEVLQRALSLATASGTSEPQ